MYRTIARIDGLTLGPPSFKQLTAGRCSVLLTDLRSPTSCPLQLDKDTVQVRPTAKYPSQGGADANIVAAITSSGEFVLEGGQSDGTSDLQVSTLVGP